MMLKFILWALNIFFLQGGDYFDEDYVVSCEVSAGRAIDDFCFPVHCSRGERRHLLALAKTGPI